jgi:hypothetical protein
MLKHEKIIELLRAAGIKYQLIPNMMWMKEAPLEYRKRPREYVEGMFAGCYMNRCISVLDGKVHICPKSSSGYGLGIVEIPNCDFIDLRDAKRDLRERIIDFYKKNCFAVCDYCERLDEKIEPAVQKGMDG